MVKNNMLIILCTLSLVPAINMSAGQSQKKSGKVFAAIAGVSLAGAILAGISLRKANKELKKIDDVWHPWGNNINHEWRKLQPFLGHVNCNEKRDFTMLVEKFTDTVSESRETDRKRANRSRIVFLACGGLVVLSGSIAAGLLIQNKAT